MLLKPLSLIASLGIITAGCTGVRPTDIGVKEGKLAPCPFTPNCVSSQSPDKEHSIDPLKYSGDPKEAMVRLKKIVQEMPRTTIVTGTGNYLHAEFASLIFRFVDDVEFSLDEAGKFIHVRSASRLGRSDLGVNRKRVEAIRQAWEKSK